MEINEAVTALSALAHAGRLAIYRLLVEAGPEGLIVGEIATRLEMPGATLSFHLAQLQQAGLVHAQRDGRQLIQTADFTQMNALVAHLTENCCGGRSCVPAALSLPAKTQRRKRKAA